MGALWTTFTNWLDGLIGPFLTAAWKGIKAAIAIATFALTFVYMIIESIDVGEAFENVATTMDNATALLSVLPISETISQLNRLFPLNEFLVFISILLGTQVLVLGLKFLKWLVDILFKIIIVIVQVVAKII
ncbi:MAG: hypothetical protein OJI67_06620 [Prosthecobacter sp.]|nr:hypothetical protein [Prosthecobacter sp.]